MMVIFLRTRIKSTHFQQPFQIVYAVRLTMLMLQPQHLIYDVYNLLRSVVSLDYIAVDIQES